MFIVTITCSGDQGKGHRLEQGPEDFAQLAGTRLDMPVLVLIGKKASGQFLIDQGRLGADAE